jgi:hypothetical protein
MKLFISFTCRSADWMKSNRPVDETPCASGALRGRTDDDLSAAGTTAARQRRNPRQISLFMATFR